MQIVNPYYQVSSRGSCEGDSGGPLMVYNTSAGQYFQVGMVSGGVSSCGNPDIPDYYVRLDHPEVSGFISNPAKYEKSGLVELQPEVSNVQGYEDTPISEVSKAQGN
jgi:secreted trypsin-like serine protease